MQPTPKTPFSAPVVIAFCALAVLAAGAFWFFGPLDWIRQVIAPAGAGAGPTAGPAGAAGKTAAPSAGAGSAPAPGAGTAPAVVADPYDLIIAGGTVIDGSGQSGRRADVGIRQGRVVLVGSLAQAPARRRIDATGLVVAPGFINPHSHTWDPIQETDPDGAASLMQGITTEFGGVDGRSFWPIGKELDAIAATGTGVNYGTFVGHGTVRGEVMGNANRAATAAELAQMADLVRAGMAAGAFGLSSGLEYVPGIYGNTAEVIQLARAAAAAGGIYSTHMRSEGDRILEALDEALRVGREAGLPVNLSHFKVVYPRNWPKFDQVLARVRTARQSGLTVFADVYPYLAPDYATTLALGDVYRNYDPETLVFRQAADRTLAGKTLAQVAAERKLAPDALARQLIAGDKPLMVAEVISEAQMLSLLQEDWAVVGTDGEALPWYDNAAAAVRVHPRSYGSYPKILGRYVRERKVMALERAVRKMTGAVADGLGLKDRGYLRPGYWADITVFDPGTVRDRATWERPQQYPEGIRYVIVNGRAAVDQGKLGPATRPGMIVRKVR